jgi:hypothetical protein
MSQSKRGRPAATVPDQARETTPKHSIPTVRQRSDQSPTLPAGDADHPLPEEAEVQETFEVTVPHQPEATNKASEATEEPKYPPPDFTPVEEEPTVGPLTAKQKQDFVRLEQTFEAKQDEAAEAIIEINERRLYREQYQTFEAYLQLRWHRSKSWGYGMIAWHRRKQLLKAAGIESIAHFGLEDSDILAELEDHPEEFVRAVVTANKRHEEKPRLKWKTILKDVKEEQVRFLAAKARFNLRPALAWEEFQTYRSLPDVPNKAIWAGISFDKVETVAAGEKISLRLALLQICKEEPAPPQPEVILRCARGADFLSLCEEIKDVQYERRKARSRERTRRRMEDEWAIEDAARQKEKEKQAGNIIQLPGAALDSTNKIILSAGSTPPSPPALPHSPPPGAIEDEDTNLGSAEGYVQVRIEVTGFIKEGKDDDLVGDFRFARKDWLVLKTPLTVKHTPTDRHFNLKQLDFKVMSIDVPNED